LTLWILFFPLNTHHNKKPLMWWFSFEGFKNVTQVFMYYCYMLLENFMCPFQSQLHLCKNLFNVPSYRYHTQDDGMFFCFACNITTHCVSDVNVKG
jgi:hypothetical protein